MNAGLDRKTGKISGDADKNLSRYPKRSLFIVTLLTREATPGMEDKIPSEGPERGLAIDRKSHRHRPAEEERQAGIESGVVIRAVGAGGFVPGGVGGLVYGVEIQDEQRKGSTGYVVSRRGKCYGSRRGGGAVPLVANT
jgi:hypothetical protein